MHTAIIDGPARDGTHSWFCQGVFAGTCTSEGFGFATPEEAIADAAAAGHPAAADPSPTYHGRFCGHPGLVWYSKVRKVKGADLKVGDWLDTLNHRGARAIYGIFAGAAPTGTDMVDVEHLRRLAGRDIDSGWLTVMVAGGETETIRVDVEYDVVDPDSQVTPDGTPVTGG